LDDTNLQRDRDYAYRACAVYFDGTACSDWQGNRIPSPAPPPAASPAPPAPAKPAPPEPPTPEPSATPGSGVQVNLRWNAPGYPFQPTKAELYRDGMVIFAMTQPGSFTTQYGDAPLRPNSGPYRYQICMTFPGPAGEKCSVEVRAGPTPIAPTAPADVRVARVDLPGGTTADGAILLRPKHRVSVSWRNTAIPGVFITVERQDVRGAPNADRDSPIEFVLGSFWNELTRLEAAASPTSALVDAEPTADPGLNSALTLQAGQTYRVCAVVPKLG